MDIIDKLNEELLKQTFAKERKLTEHLDEYKHIASMYARTENAIAVLSDMKTNTTGRTGHQQDGSFDMGRRNIRPDAPGRFTGKAFAGTPLLPFPEKHPKPETPGLLPHAQHAYAG